MTLHKIKFSFGGRIFTTKAVVSVAAAPNKHADTGSFLWERNCKLCSGTTTSLKMFSRKICFACKAIETLACAIGWKKPKKKYHSFPHFWALLHRISGPGTCRL